MLFSDEDAYFTSEIISPQYHWQDTFRKTILNVGKPYRTIPPYPLQGAKLPETGAMRRFSCTILTRI
jgi:hypothetical protein